VDFEKAVLLDSEVLISCVISKSANHEGEVTFFLVLGGEVIAQEVENNRDQSASVNFTFRAIKETSGG
jgi:hypothetical protein